MCYHCDKAGHLASRCRVDKDVICHKCKKPGHLTRACSIQPNKLPSRPKKSSSSPSSSFRKNKSRSVHQVKEEKCDEEQLLHLFSVRSQEHTKEPPITAELKLDGQHGGGHWCCHFCDVLSHCLQSCGQGGAWSLL